MDFPWTHGMIGILPAIRGWRATGLTTLRTRRCLIRSLHASPYPSSSPPQVVAQFEISIGLAGPVRIRQRLPILQQKWIADVGMFRLVQIVFKIRGGDSYEAFVAVRFYSAIRVGVMGIRSSSRVCDGTPRRG